MNHDGLMTGYQDDNLRTLIYDAFLKVYSWREREKRLSEPLLYMIMSFKTALKNRIVRSFLPKKFVQK
jgi:hypothetical protein